MYILNNIVLVCWIESRLKYIIYLHHVSFKFAYLKAYFLCTTLTLNGGANMTKPTLYFSGSDGGGLSFDPGSNVKFCIRVTRSRNKRFLASTSPKQILFPTPKGNSLSKIEQD